MKKRDGHVLNVEAPFVFIKDIVSGVELAKNTAFLTSNALLCNLDKKIRKVYIYQ